MSVRFPVCMIIREIPFYIKGRSFRFCPLVLFHSQIHHSSRGYTKRQGVTDAHKGPGVRLQQDMSDAVNVSSGAQQ